MPHLHLHHLHLPQFSGSEPTVRFLKLIDHLFDVLNSRNPVARGFKAALRPSNFHLWDPFLDEAFAYIMSLKDTSGQSMTSTRRKTPFIVFYVRYRLLSHCISSMLQVLMHQ